MAVTVETLEKLERKITLTLPVGVIQNEVETRLRKLARTVKMDGFRPGKVPMNVVGQRYGYSVQHEVMNDKVGEAFAAAAKEAQLLVAGQRRISENATAPEGQVAFDAVFEVFPVVKFTDFATAEVEKVTTEVTEAAVDKTVDILRKQRRTFAQRAPDAVAVETDRVTVNFEGKIDGESFEGGKAEGFQFVVGDGQMLQEFEAAVRGMKAGESKTFQLAFPADYHGKDVAGKTADFMVTVLKIEAAHIPEMDGEFAKSLGIADASVDGLRADIRKNLQREVKSRLLARNKQVVMDALLSRSELDVPKVSVQAELERMIQRTREDLKQRGMKDAEKAPIPENIFLAQAEKRVRLGLVVAALVNMSNLQAKPEQIKAYVEELASSYETPAEVVRWYYSDNRRMADVEGMVIESNVIDFVLSKSKVTEKSISFDELMGQN
ncbi:MAG: trigger factor [Burkholderiales bacterium]|nr:trigger factor [Burkholderiales bacterium]